MNGCAPSSKRRRRTAAERRCSVAPRKGKCRIATLNFASLLEFAVEAAQLAGSYTLGFFQADTPHELKDDRSPVTAADRGAEERLRARIGQYFPDHAILGEEFGEKAGRPGAPRWILDPVDGTYSFICGVPLYSTLIALQYENEMQLGVLHLPALRETIYAARGLGCWWNGRRARVSDVATVADARLCNTGTKKLPEYGRAAGFARLRDVVQADRGWSDAYAYALVATGRADIAVDPVMELWDVAPLVPIIEEAGGRITTWEGWRDPYAREALATNGVLHNAVVELAARRPGD